MCADEELMMDMRAGLDRSMPKFDGSDVLTFDDFSEDFDGAENTAFTRTLPNTWFDDIP